MSTMDAATVFCMYDNIIAKQMHNGLGKLYGILNLG